MKFAIRLPANYLYQAITSPWEAALPPSDALHFARTVDMLGYDYLWVSEHIVQHPELVSSFGAKFYEGLSAAAVLLGATRRIKLLTYVTPLPYHNPLVYAKAVATVDHLSSGRLALGLSSGHLRCEFSALGVPYEQRGALCDEYLCAMRELWTSDNPVFHGKYVQFEDIAFEPKPFQYPYPPILIGGDAPPVLRRAAKYGNGWLPWLTRHSELRGAIQYIYDQPAMQARNEPFDIYPLLVTIPEDDRLEINRLEIPLEKQEILDMSHSLEDAGATGVIVHLPITGSFDQCLAWVEWFSEEIIAAFKRSKQ